MESSGYEAMARAEAIWAGISGHNRTVARRERGELMETDQTWATRGRRLIRKLRDKKEWFQKQSESKEPNLTHSDNQNSWRHNYKTSPATTTTDRGLPISTLHVPATPEIELARRL